MDFGEYEQMSCNQTTSHYQNLARYYKFCWKHLKRSLQYAHINLVNSSPLMNTVSKFFFRSNVIIVTVAQKLQLQMIMTYTWALLQTLGSPTGLPYLSTDNDLCNYSHIQQPTSMNVCKWQKAVITYS